MLLNFITSIWQFFITTKSPFPHHKVSLEKQNVYNFYFLTESSKMINDQFKKLLSICIITQKIFSRYYKLWHFLKKKDTLPPSSGFKSPNSFMALSVKASYRILKCSNRWKGCHNYYSWKDPFLNDVFLGNIEKLFKI